MRVQKLKAKQQQQVILDAKTFRDLPELGSITCQNYQAQFDKSIKQYVLVPKEDLLSKYLIQVTPISSKINPQKIILQIYLLEKLKMQIFVADQNEQLYQFTVNPKQQMMQRTKEEVNISSSFILTNKWISLCIDFQSFFNSNQLILKSLQLTSTCKLKQIYEPQQTIQTISDGQFMIQRINQKRIQELVDTQNRCSSVDRPARKSLIQRPSKIKERSSSKSLEPKEIILPQIHQKSKVEIIFQKNVKMATGLQVIEEIQPKKRPGMQTQELKQNKIEIDFKQKAVKSFIRPQDFASPTSDNKRKILEKEKKSPQMIKSPSRQSKELKEEFFQNMKIDEQQELDSFYNSKVHKFSNTFQKPLGFSSMNFKLASQNSNTFTQLQQHTTQDYFYLSSQQFIQNPGNNQDEEAKSHLTESQVEERIDEDKEDMRNGYESIYSQGNSQLKQQNLSHQESSEIVVSQFM